MLSAWENFTVEVEQYLQLDDERVLVLLHNHGRGKASGVDVEQIAARTANLLHVQEDKVIRFVMYWDRERAFENLGIDPMRSPARIRLAVLDALLHEVRVARLGDRQIAERLVDRVEHVLG